MRNNKSLSSAAFYKRTIERINQELKVKDNHCFVLVQHAFLPSIEFYKSIEDHVAAIVLKGSSSVQNPSVVAKLKNIYGPRLLDNVGRHALSNSDFALELLRTTTKGRPFVILEYGAYFAPMLVAIHKDPELSKNLLGIVEGTVNGIQGSEDGRTPGYSDVAHLAPCPIISKSRSNIKHIMDLDIGPAIVSASNNILMQHCGQPLEHWRGTIGLVGLGSIGLGILSALKFAKHDPLVFDSNVATQAKLAHQQNNVANQQTILERSDILFLSTGSCFLSKKPDLLASIKNNALLILSTSGDVEAGIPQLIENGHLKLIDDLSNSDVATFQITSSKTTTGKTLRVMLGADGVGQAPNMSAEDGSSSMANLMSDMEFFALGAYLGTKHPLTSGHIHSSPDSLQAIIFQEWLAQLYPLSMDSPATTLSPKPAAKLNQHKIVDAES